MNAQIKRYEKWKADFDSYTGKTEREAQKTEEVLQPLISELKNIDEKIRAKKRQIHMKRAAIARNDSRIADLLRMVTSIQSDRGGIKSKMFSSSSNNESGSSKRPDASEEEEEEEEEVLFGGK